MRLISGFHLGDSDTFETEFARFHGRVPVALELALRHVTRWDLAVDVGAHIGTWSVNLAERFGRVIAFEPSAESFAFLERNLIDCSNVQTVRSAVGQQNRLVGLDQNPDRPLNSGCRRVNLSGAGVTMVMLDAYSGSTDHLTGLGLLKIDTEGFELPVLTGGEDTIRRERPIVVIEERHAADFGFPDDGARKLLTEWGMRLVDSCGEDFIWGW